MLHSGTQYLVTSTSSPDLGTQKGGRPARLRAPLTAAAPLALTLDGLDSWHAGDALEFFVSEENDWDFNTERLVLANPGNTSLSFTLDVSRVDGGPASAIQAQGDHA